jgi:hypothetical protein
VVWRSTRGAGRAVVRMGVGQGGSNKAGADIIGARFNRGRLINIMVRV